MSFFDVVKALIPLLLIVGLLYGVLVFVKKYGISVKGKRSNLVAIDVLSSQMIMPKKFISVVRVDDRLLILGVSEQSITLLKEVEQPLDFNDDKDFDNNNKPNLFAGQNNIIEVLKKNLGMK